MKSKGKLLSQSVKSLEVTTKKCAFEQKKKRKKTERRKGKGKEKGIEIKEKIYSQCICAFAMVCIR